MGAGERRGEGRARAEREGRRAELLAAWYMRLQGWRVLEKRMKTARGEIDLVLRRRRTLCLLEVKWRAQKQDRDLAIDGWRLRRVADAAPLAAVRHARPGDSVRIDVLLLSPGCWPRHLVNAWMPCD